VILKDLIPHNLPLGKGEARKDTFMMAKVIFIAIELDFSISMKSIESEFLKEYLP